MNMMEYKGFLGVVNYDEEAEIFFGKVTNLPNDGITFEGSSVAELKKAFHDSVNDYLAWCKESGKEPEKPFSGKFLVRIPPALHARAALEASKEGVSLNGLVTKVLQEAIQ